MKQEIVLAISILLSLLAVKILIPILQRMKVGQPIREEGNKEHYAKAGTPTMGGVAFVLVFVVLSLLISGFNFDNLIIIAATLAFGLIGFIDDYTKVKKSENLGLTERQKLILQIGFALIISLIIYFNKEDMGYVLIPIINYKLNLGIFAVALYSFVFVGATNAVNLTDGIDGLLSSVSLPVFAGIAILSAAIPTISNSAIIFIGVLLGFIAFNSNPASVFMGDTGSMAIGGAVTAMMILINLTLYLAIIGGIYVAEAMSVIIQVISYKTRSKRVFLMSPIHHHFELKGHKEPKIVANFTIVSILLTLLTLYLVR